MKEMGGEMRGVGLLLALASVSVFAADFDVNRYCREVSEVAGGSYQIEKSCRSQETRSRERVASASVPARVMAYCDEVATVVGGSYQILESCIKQELAAKAGMR